MHDVGRNFRSIETLKADIDEMARLKLNAFHWHLTVSPHGASSARSTLC